MKITQGLELVKLIISTTVLDTFVYGLEQHLNQQIDHKPRVWISAAGQS